MVHHHSYFILCLLPYLLHHLLLCPLLHHLLYLLLQHPLYLPRHLRLTVADMGGTLAVVDATGEIRWDANLSGTLPHTPTIGDVDGDGQVFCDKSMRNYLFLFKICLFSVL